jgi:hypothetical protein
MAISDEVASLTTAVDNLTSAVNVKKATLDQKVTDATTEANRADSEADRATTQANNAASSATAASGSASAAATSASEAQGFRDEAEAIALGDNVTYDPAAQHIPLADLDGKINYDYLPLAAPLAAIAASTIEGEVKDLEEFFHEREQEDEFDGIHAELSHVDAELQRLEDKIDGKQVGIPSTFQAIIEQDFLVDGFSSAYQAEILRGMGGSGVYVNRNYGIDDGSIGKRRPFTAGSTQLHQHNHPNYYRMIGLGEQSAIVNGYYVRTTHNDPRLVDQDGRELDAPPIPSSVLSKPTGVTLSGTTTVLDTASDTQARYMRNQFTTNIGDCRLDLIYMEVWLQALTVDGTLNDDSLSFRHSENADTLRGLLEFAEKLNFSGAKDTPENGSFRSGMISFVGEDGVPEYAFVTYRLRAKSVGKPSTRTAKTTYTDGDVTPNLNFGVVASGFGGTHGHSLEVALTPDEMNTLIGGGTIYAETGYNKAPASPEEENHSHLWELTWNGSTVTGMSIGARAYDAPVNEFLAVNPSYTPTISSYRMADGTYSSNPVVWNTAAQPHVHPLDVKIVQDRFPFDLYKAVNHIIDNDNRYLLVKDQLELQRLRDSNPNAGWKELAESNFARFKLRDDDLQAICEGVWGLDGEGAYIPEDINSYGSVYSTYDPANPSDRLNMARYNRTYNYGAAGASGRSSAKRGFSDPTLYVAKTTRSDVVEGYTWMIPLELVVRAPVEIWNPWNLILIEGRPTSSNSSGNGSQSSPWNAAFTQLWYSMLPTGLFSASDDDPANTATGGTWVMSNDGNAYPANNSGIWVKYDNAGDYRDLNGNPYSTVFRQRIVIAPVWHEFTYGNVQLENFKDTVKTALKGIRAGTMSDADIDNII